jgi:hypothetical protein
MKSSLPIIKTDMKKYRITSAIVAGLMVIKTEK